MTKNRKEEKRITLTVFARAAAAAIVMFAASCCATPSGDAGAADASDATLASDATNDAASDARILAWSLPVPIAELNTDLDEKHATITNDGALFFSRTQTVGQFIVEVSYRSERESFDAPFGNAIRPFSTGTTSYHELSVSADELELFYWTGLGELSSSSRSDVTSPWGPPLPIGFSGRSPAISNDGLRLYFLEFVSRELFFVERPHRAAAFGNPIAIPIESPFGIESIDVSDDELTLLITADPLGVVRGVFIAKRSDLQSPFGAPVAIKSLQSTYEGAAFGEDNREIFVHRDFSGNRELLRSVLQ